MTTSHCDHRHTAHQFNSILAFGKGVVGHNVLQPPHLMTDNRGQAADSNIIQMVIPCLHTDGTDLSHWHDALHGLEANATDTSPDPSCRTRDDEVPSLIADTSADHGGVSRMIEYDIGKRHRTSLFVDKFSYQTMVGLLNTFHEDSVTPVSNRHRVETNDSTDSIVKRQSLKTASDSKILQFVVDEIDRLTVTGIIQVFKYLRQRLVMVTAGHSGLSAHGGGNKTEQQDGNNLFHGLFDK